MQQQGEENENPSLISPSFNSYSSNELVEIARKVSHEFKYQADDNDDEFEFSLTLDHRHPQASTDDFSYIGPIFPIFNRDITDSNNINLNSSGVSLKNLFIEEREDRDPPSSSSSEADELEAVPPGTYCVWRPDIVKSSPSTCRKSKSTGSASKRFRIRDFLRRSNSDGKDSFVFLTPKKTDDNLVLEKKSEKVVGEDLKMRRHSVDSGKVNGKPKVLAPASPASSAHELFYVQNRAMKEGDKRKSYLPYRKDLVGFFANVNGLGKTYSKGFPQF